MRGGIFCPHALNPDTWQNQARAAQLISRNLKKNINELREQNSCNL